MSTQRFTEEQVRSCVRASVATIGALEGQADVIYGACERMVACLRRGGKVLTAGNGGSAAEALHMAEELVGRYKGNRVSLPGIALVADCTALTCIGNDYGFDAIFSRQVEGLGRPGDLLVLFSTSGKAANLLRAAEAARVAGVETIGFLGRDGGPLAAALDLALIVRDGATERIQEAHQVLLHILLEAVETAFPAGVGA